MNPSRMNNGKGEFLRILTPEELALLYDAEMRDAFPPAELKPLASIEKLRALGRYEPLGMFDGEGTLLAYCLMWTDPEGSYPLIDYLGVPAALRNRGLGGRALALVKEHFSAAGGILADVEAEEAGDPAERDLRRRRLGFYARCGFVTLPYDSALFGVHYKVLLLPNGPADPARALEDHQTLYRRQFRTGAFRRYVQLPLQPGEAVIPFTPWTEE